LTSNEPNVKTYALTDKGMSKLPTTLPSNRYGMAEKDDKTVAFNGISKTFFLLI
jgi:hypothetical protein